MLFQIANHPLLIRRIYNDEDVIRFARKLHPIGAFGVECTLDRGIEELKNYNDFCIHRVNLLLRTMQLVGFECTLDRVIERFCENTHFANSFLHLQD